MFSRPAFVMLLFAAWISLLAGAYAEDKEHEANALAAEWSDAEGNLYTREGRAMYLRTPLDMQRGPGTLLFYITRSEGETVQGQWLNGDLAQQAASGVFNADGLTLTGAGDWTRTLRPTGVAESSAPQTRVAPSSLTEFAPPWRIGVNEVVAQDTPIAVRFTMRVTPPAGSSPWVTVVPEGATAPAYGQYFYTEGAETGLMTFDPLPPGRYEARLHIPYSSRAPLDVAAFEVVSADLVPQPEAGPSAASTGDAPQSALTVADTVAEGAPIQVEFDDPAPGQRPWLTIVPVGSHGAAFGQSFYTDGAAQGAVAFDAPAPGRYEARLHPDDLSDAPIAAAEFEVARNVVEQVEDRATEPARAGAAQDTTISVETAAAAAARAEDVPRARPTLEVPDTIPAFEPFTIRFTDPEPGERPQISIAGEGATEVGLHTFLTNGAAFGSFLVEGLPPGSYEARFLASRDLDAADRTVPFEVLPPVGAADASASGASETAATAAMEGGACRLSQIAGVYDTQLGRLACSAVDDRLRCCYGEAPDHCERSVALSWDADTRRLEGIWEGLADVWGEVNPRNGAATFGVSESCELADGLYGLDSGEAEAPWRVTSRVGSPDQSIDYGGSASCSPEDVAGIYRMRFSPLSCAAQGDGVRCCLDGSARACRRWADLDIDQGNNRIAGTWQDYLDRRGTVAFPLTWSCGLASGAGTNDWHPNDRVENWTVYERRDRPAPGTITPASPAGVCGVPEPDPNDATAFIARADGAADRGCISLARFVGQDVDIERIDSNPEVMDVRLDTMPVAATVTRLPVRMRAAEMVIESRQRDASQYAVRIRPVRQIDLSERVTAEWVYRGGYGFGAPVAELRDDVGSIVRLTCGGDVGGTQLNVKVEITRRFTPPGQRPMLGLGAGVPLWGLMYGPPEPPDAMSVARLFLTTSTGIDRFPPLFSALSAETLDIDGTRIGNRYLKEALSSLLRACHAGVPQGPSLAGPCRPPILHGATQCSDDMIPLRHRIFLTYAALTSTASDAEVQSLWRRFAEDLEQMATCHLGATGPHGECLSRAYDRSREWLEAAAPPEAQAAVEAAILEPLGRATSPLPPDVVAEFLDQGLPRDTVDQMQLVTIAEDMTLAILDPGGMSTVSLFVLHDLSGADTPQSMTVDPGMPGLHPLVAETVIPALVERGRRGPFRINALHFVTGLPVGDGIPVSSGFTDAEISRGRDGATSTRVPVFLTALARTVDEAAAEARRARALAEERRREGEARRAAERAALFANEVEAARTAKALGFVYKNPSFWQAFDAPDAVRPVFQGLAPASDRQILGWAVAYDQLCADHLPDAVTVFTDITETEIRTLYGVTRSSWREIRTLTVDARFARAVTRARRGDVDTEIALDALGLGDGRSLPDWDRVIGAARQISQPAADARRILSSGCQSPVATQYLQNLLAGAGYGQSVRAEAILDPATARAASDPPPN